MIGFDLDAVFVDLEGCRAWAMVGNGRRAREVAKAEFRFGRVGLCMGALAALDESASGDETRGRVMVIERVAVVAVSNGGGEQERRDLPMVIKYSGNGRWGGRGAKEGGILYAGGSVS